MKPNIIIRAPIFSLSGYGAHSRDIVLSLFKSKKYNVSVAPTGWGISSTIDDFPPEVMDILVFTCNNKINTNDFTFIHVGIPTEFQKIGKINIGITAGLESDRIPESWVKGCEQVDAVIVPSTFVRDTFIRSGVKKPVFVVGEGVDTSVFNPSVECKLPLEFSTEFNFLSVGQWMTQNTGDDRKQIGLLLQSFCEVFSENKNVGLVLKTYVNNASSPDFYYTKQRVEQFKKGKPYPKIYLVHGIMTENELAQLYCHPQIKAYVSLTSGEGWNRPLSEAIACDLPALITGWSGHMDFIDKNYITLFDHTMELVPPSVVAGGLFEQGMNWAKVKPDDAKRKIRRCVDGYSIAKERAVKLGEIFRLAWGKDKVYAKLVDTVDSLVKSNASSVVAGGGISLQKI